MAQPDDCVTVTVRPATVIVADRELRELVVAIGEHREPHAVELLRERGVRVVDPDAKTPTARNMAPISSSPR